MSFTTVDEVALFLNRDIADLTDFEHAQINMAILYVDGVINNYCGWNMLATDYVDKRYDGSGLSTQDLRLYPINSVTTVKSREADGSFTDATLGVEILEGGILQFLPYATTSVTTFTAGVTNWFISFNAGFEEGNIPFELAYAANFLTTLHFNKFRDENLGEDEEKFGEATFKNTNLVLPKTVTRVLDRYRLVSIF
jgi:hypothetical protein